jgi:hypothetical protein
MGRLKHSEEGSEVVDRKTAAACDKESRVER